MEHLELVQQAELQNSNCPAVNVVLLVVESIASEFVGPVDVANAAVADVAAVVVAAAAVVVAAAAVAILALD